MAPGLLTAGGKLPDKEHALPADTAIAIFAQDKELPLAVGLLRQGTEEIKEKRKGSVIDNLHTIGGTYHRSLAYIDLFPFPSLPSLLFDLYQREQKYCRDLF